MDATGGKVNVGPLQSENLAGSESRQRPDGIRHIERLRKVKKDAPDVLKLLDERCGSRVVRRSHRSPDYARQRATWIHRGEFSLHQVCEDRREKRDANSDGGRVESRVLLCLEGSSTGDESLSCLDALVHSRTQIFHLPTFSRPRMRWRAACASLQKRFLLRRSKGTPHSSHRPRDS